MSKNKDNFVTLEIGGDSSDFADIYRNFFKVVKEKDHKIEVLTRALEMAIKECIKHKFCPDDTCFVKNIYGGNCKYCIANHFKLEAEKELENDRSRE